MSRTLYSKTAGKKKTFLEANHTFFKMVSEVHPYKVGDIITRSMWHHNFVVNTVASKTVKYNVTWHIAKKLGIKVPYEYYSQIEKIVRENMVPLERWELVKIYPHLSKRIKTKADKMLKEYEK